MDMLLVGVGTLFCFFESEKILCVSYDPIIYIGSVSLILLPMLIIVMLTIDITDKQRLINDMRQEASSRHNKISKLDNELKSSSLQIGQLRKDLANATSKLNRRDKRIESMNKNLQKKSDEMSNLSIEIKSLKSILKETTKTLKEKEKALENCKLIIDKKEEEKTSLHKKISSLQDSINSKVLELEVARNQLLEIENELSMIKASKELNPFERLANW